eukprot:CAMPEP_0119552818 /NCGR_PEP_ID=MMETSP1352-20130426/5724_1 /TAXON_ID=265584 /ORGANISM="Stauroneis constricta, Strain CCMP1120" /LENGTH=1021 /DNA_ID=CAMNT_0007599119 /DNA_START=342 /DNA_END=3407 /DNA_ORIENTATION=+
MQRSAAYKHGMSRRKHPHQPHTKPQQHQRKQHGKPPMHSSSASSSSSAAAAAAAAKAGAAASSKVSTAVSSSHQQKEWTTIQSLQRRRFNLCRYTIKIKELILCTTTSKTTQIDVSQLTTSNFAKIQRHLQKLRLKKCDDCQQRRCRQYLCRDSTHVVHRFKVAESMVQAYEEEGSRKSGNDDDSHNDNDEHDDSDDCSNSDDDESCKEVVVDPDSTPKRNGPAAANDQDALGQSLLPCINLISNESNESSSYNADDDLRADLISSVHFFLMSLDALNDRFTRIYHRHKRLREMLVTLTTAEPNEGMAQRIERYIDAGELIDVDTGRTIDNDQQKVRTLFKYDSTPPACLNNKPADDSKGPIHLPVALKRLHRFIAELIGSEGFGSSLNGNHDEVLSDACQDILNWQHNFRRPQYLEVGNPKSSSIRDCSLLPGMHPLTHAVITKIRRILQMNKTLRQQSESLVLAKLGLQRLDLILPHQFPCINVPLFDGGQSTEDIADIAEAASRNVAQSLLATMLRAFDFLGGGKSCKAQGLVLTPFWIEVVEVELRGIGWEDASVVSRTTGALPLFHAATTRCLCGKDDDMFNELSKMLYAPPAQQEKLAATTTAKSAAVSADELSSSSRSSVGSVSTSSLSSSSTSSSSSPSPPSAPSVPRASFTSTKSMHSASSSMSSTTTTAAKPERSGLPTGFTLLCNFLNSVEHGNNFAPDWSSTFRSIESTSKSNANKYAVNLSMDQLSDDAHTVTYISTIMQRKKSLFVSDIVYVRMAKRGPQKLAREFQVLKKLSHKCIPAVFKEGTIGRSDHHLNSSRMAMLLTSNHVTGSAGKVFLPLQSFVEAVKEDDGCLQSIVQATVDAVEHAHARGWSHQAIGISNVFVLRARNKTGKVCYRTMLMNWGNATKIGSVGLLTADNLEYARGQTIFNRISLLPQMAMEDDDLVSISLMAARLLRYSEYHETIPFEASKPSIQQKCTQRYLSAIDALSDMSNTALDTLLRAELLEYMTYEPSYCEEARRALSNGTE